MSEATDRLEADLAADRARLAETLHTLEARVAPGSLAREAMHYFEGASSDFAARLGRQLYDNPLPSLLTGIGLAWLISSSMTPHSPQGPSAEELRDHDLLNMLEEEEARTLRRDDEELSAYENRKLSSMALVAGVTRDEGEEHESFRRRVGAAIEKIRDGARIAREKIAAAAGAVGHGVGAAASAAKNAAGGAAQFTGAAHLAGNAAHLAKSGASAAAHGASATAKAASAGASSLYRGAKEAPARLAAFNEDHPLASGAVGFALGAVIGSVTPLTRAEHDALKKLADAGLARGASVAEDAARFMSGAAQDIGEPPAAPAA